MYNNKYQADHNRRIVWYDLDGSLSESEKRCLIDSGYQFLKAKDAKCFHPRTQRIKQLGLWD